MELADWELKEALQSAKEDREWEKEEEVQGEELKSGQIGVRINFQGGKPLLNLKGIGQTTKNAITKLKGDVSEEEKSTSSEKKTQVIVYSTPPAIATKSVLAQDLFNVSSIALGDRSAGKYLTITDSSHHATGCSSAQ